MKRTFFAVVLCSCVAVLHGNVMFITGNNHQPGEVNVLADKVETGTTVMGRIIEFPNITVDFTSTETLLTNSNGQAEVTGCAAPCITPPFATSPIDNISISLAGGQTYGDLIFDPHFLMDCTTCGGTATVTVTAELGGVVEHFTDQLPIEKGQNFLTIITTGGERIQTTNVSDSDALNFSDIRQVRLSGLEGTPIPEPSSYAPLMALALGVITRLRRSRKV